MPAPIRPLSRLPDISRREQPSTVPSHRRPQGRNLRQLICRPDGVVCFILDIEMATRTLRPMNRNSTGVGVTLPAISDVAHHAAEDGLEPPQFARPIVLLAVGIAALLHERLAADPFVALPQGRAPFLSQPHQATSRALCISLASVGKLTAFGWAVVSTVSAPDRRTGARDGPPPSSPTPAPPTRRRLCAGSSGSSRSGPPAGCAGRRSRRRSQRAQTAASDRSCMCLSRCSPTISRVGTTGRLTTLTVNVVNTFPHSPAGRSLLREHNARSNGGTEDNADQLGNAEPK